MVLYTWLKIKMILFQKCRLDDKDINISEPLTLLLGIQPNFHNLGISFSYSLNRHIHKPKMG